MTPERWEEVVKMISERFEVLDRYQEDLDPGTAEVIEFQTPAGRLKACFNRRPKVLGKKTLYSHRPGAEVRVDYQYSDEETTTFLTLFKWSEERQSWQTMEGHQLF